MHSTHFPWGPITGWLVAGETKEDCARRVCLEQTGGKIFDVSDMGMVRFFARSQRSEPDRVLHVLTSHRPQDIFLDKQERRLLRETWEFQWFPVHKLPLRLMSDEDRYWISYVLGKRRFEADFFYQGPYEDPEDIIGLNISIIC
ncbi:NUDIX domain-containing protein [Candidatus Bathyarchaeota archaeon]|nr:NUDIX domain-containing protein [Candidatus Bathyarchaeota archaeon]